MEDEQDDEHVGRKSGIENKLRQNLSLYVIAHDELTDELESHEQNDPEQIKLRNDCITESCAAISQCNDGATGDGVTYAKMLNRAKTRDSGHNAKSRIQTKDTERCKRTSAATLNSRARWTRVRMVGRDSLVSAFQQRLLDCACHAEPKTNGCIRR